MENTTILKNNKIMKKQVRKGIFETNSSSTHTLVLCSKEMWKKFKNNEDVYLELYGETSFVTKETIEKSKNYQKYIEHICPNFSNLNEDEKNELFENYLEEECFATNEYLEDECEVLLKEVPNSDYIAVSIYKED